MTLKINYGLIDPFPYNKKEPKTSS